jgi:hypothetical protein
MGGRFAATGSTARGMLKVSPNVRIIHYVIERYGNLGVCESDQGAGWGASTRNQCRDVLRSPNRQRVRALSSDATRIL